MPPEALLIADYARGIAGLEMAVIDLDTLGQHMFPRLSQGQNGEVVAIIQPTRG